MEAVQMRRGNPQGRTRCVGYDDRLAARVALRLVPWVLVPWVLCGAALTVGVAARAQQEAPLPDDPSAHWHTAQDATAEPARAVPRSFTMGTLDADTAAITSVHAFHVRASVPTIVASLETPWPSLPVTADDRVSSSLQSDTGQPSAEQAAPSQAGPAHTLQCPTGLLADFVVVHRQDRYACQRQDPLQFIVEPGPVAPLTPTQKGVLAARGVINPFNLLTIAAFSAVSVAANAHSAYGPGFHGWGLLMGYSLVEDIQGETTGTFLLPVAFHEDPRYHRLPGQPFTHRLVHALGHTVLSQGDDGHIMPNYATLINYPLSAEISNLYVPGIGPNGPSTVKRIALGYATDPVGAIVAEFLPDVARRVHIHIIFAQQILNQIATGQLTGQQ
jgi:hypothetical protein